MRIAAPRRVVLWPDARKRGARFALNTRPDHDPMENLQAAERGNLSVYARHRDYHDIMKRRGCAPSPRLMAERFATEVKLFVDHGTRAGKTAPLAAAAGIGWQGQAAPNLVSRDYGSWLFLGEIFTSLDLAPTRPRRIIAAAAATASTSAQTAGPFPEPYRLDARRLHLLSHHRA